MSWSFANALCGSRGGLGWGLGCKGKGGGGVGICFAFIRGFEPLRSDIRSVCTLHDSQHPHLFSSRPLTVSF